MSDQETLESLAAKVGELTNAVTSCMKSLGLPPVSFAAGSSAEYPMAMELTGPRSKLVEALTDMLHLAKGGKDVILYDSLAVRTPSQRKSLSAEHTTRASTT